ncbi:TetR/AcrR family transcriptional regulator [Nocardia sp. BMG111209]|uniref:TetR/AcrR family transcriptional regulator n=1 Tax=Nocardia sp. BMG111209 TaxID=1160137 RepID=UPI00035DB259|nr:TetR/AcrR family transcriptional regulator [Nocardia sp. BMG111209]
MISKSERGRRSRDRILDAAREIFAERGYERTTIRAVAAAAAVDPALVMQHFGSKQQLFTACVRDAVPAPESRDPLEYALDMLSTRLEKEPTTSLALLRSMLTHPEATDELRRALEEQQARFATGIDAPDRNLRADLIGALILGVVLNRHLLRPSALAGADPEQILDILRPCLRELTGPR